MSKVPAEWNTTRVHLIPKDRSNLSIAKTRPISLTQVPRRLFEKVVLKNWAGESWMRTEESQHGFKKGFNCASQLATVSERYTRGEKTMLFLDLRAAYDKVDISILLRKLKKRKCPAGTIRLVWEMFGRPGTVIPTMNGRETPPFQRTRGLMQGSSLSPCLFNIYIDDLAGQFKEAGITAALFADDIAILVRNPAVLQRAADMAQEWAVGNRMEFNVSKCGYIGQVEGKIQLGCEEIPKVTGYKYLGAQVNKDGVDWRSTVKQQERAIERQGLELRDRCTKWGKVKAGWILDTFIRPKAEYLRPLGHLWSTTRRPEVQVEAKARRRRIEETIWKLANTGESLPITEEQKIEAREKTLARGFQESMRKLPSSNWLWTAAGKQGSLAELLMTKKI